MTRPFEGVIPNMERRYRETDFELDPRGIRALPEQPPLRRLRRLPAAARGAGGEDRGRCMSGQVVQMSIREALDWCRQRARAA